MSPHDPLHKLRRRCQRILRDRWPTLLGARGSDPPRDLTELCERVSELRGRLVIPIGWSWRPASPFGITLARPDADYISYEIHTAPYHQNMILAHELGHILAGHRGYAITEQELLDKLTCGDLTGFRDLLLRQAPDDGAGGGEVYERSLYQTRAEQEAEMIATLLITAFDDLRPVQAAAVPDDFAAAITRIERALRDQPPGI